MLFSGIGASGASCCKRAGSLQVVVGAHFVGAVGFLVLALVTGEAQPGVTNLLWCGAAGFAGAVGLLALYRALDLQQHAL